MGRGIKCKTSGRLGISEVTDGLEGSPTLRCTGFYAIPPCV